MPLSDVDYEAPFEETADEPAEIQPANGEIPPLAPESAPVELSVARDDETTPDEQPPKPSAPDIPGEPPREKQLIEIRRFQTRLETAQNRISNPVGNDEQWAALVEQAITLLETVSQHPALANYSANKRTLDDIEQRLGYGAYPQ